MSKHITKKTAQEIFRRDFLPEIRRKEAQFPNLRIDHAMRRATWNDMVDSLQKAGYVSQQQAETWSNPYDK